MKILVIFSAAICCLCATTAFAQLDGILPPDINEMHRPRVMSFFSIHSEGLPGLWWLAPVQEGGEDKRSSATAAASNSATSREHTGAKSGKTAQRLARQSADDDGDDDGRGPPKKDLKGENVVDSEEVKRLIRKIIRLEKDLVRSLRRLSDHSNRDNTARYKAIGRLRSQLAILSWQLWEMERPQ